MSKKDQLSTVLALLPGYLISQTGEGELSQLNKSLWKNKYLDGNLY